MKSLKLLSIIGLGALLFTGCAKNDVKPQITAKDCKVGTFFEEETKSCQKILTKREGVVREVHDEIILVSMEDNTLLKLKKGDKSYKVGDFISIIIKK